MNYLRGYIEQGIRDHHEESQKAWDKRNRLVGPRLHPSSVAGCPRAAILTAVGSFPEHPLYQEITHPFELYTQSVMMSGNVWEKVISDMLMDPLSGDRSIRMSNDVWAWELDGLIEPGISPEFPEGLIIEIKDSAIWNFRAKNRLPYLRHAVQVAVYQRLTEKATGEHYPAHIYYNGRGAWAEFSVEVTDAIIRCVGLVNDRPRDVYFDYDVEAAMALLESYWERQELPPRYDDPFEHDFTCVRGSAKKGYFANCKWCGACWPDMPEGPFPQSSMLLG